MLSNDTSSGSLHPLETTKSNSIELSAGNSCLHINEPEFLGRPRSFIAFDKIDQQHPTHSTPPTLHPRAAEQVVP